MCLKCRSLSLKANLQRSQGQAKGSLGTGKRNYLLRLLDLLRLLLLSLFLSSSDATLSAFSPSTGSSLTSCKGREASSTCTSSSQYASKFRMKDDAFEDSQEAAGFLRPGCHLRSSCCEDRLTLSRSGEIDILAQDCHSVM